MGEILGRALLIYAAVFLGGTLIVSFIIGLVFSLIKSLTKSYLSKNQPNAIGNKTPAWKHLVYGLVFAVCGLIIFFIISYTQSYISSHNWKKQIHQADEVKNKIILSQTKINFTGKNKFGYEDKPIKAFIYTPFKITEAIDAKSVFILASNYDGIQKIKFSSSNICDRGYPTPANGFAITEKSNSLDSSITYESTANLETGKQYYLLKTITFARECNLADFKDFDSASLPKPNF